MNSPVPSAPVADAPVRRRRWPWVLAAMLAPFAIAAACVVSYVTLDRDAAVLRRHVMTATGADWTTKVQVSVGQVTLAAVGAGLGFVDQPNIEEARGALRAIDSASVGVYELASSEANWDPSKILRDTDSAMARRGWSRVVGVAGQRETVMIYSPKNLKPNGPLDLALAVVSGRELVVVSATLDPIAFEKFVDRFADRKIQLHLNQFARR